MLTRSTSIILHTFLVKFYPNRAKIESGANHIPAAHAFAAATFRLGLRDTLVARNSTVDVNRLGHYNLTDT